MHKLSGVCKAQIQAIRRILHVVIMKILARAKKGREVSSPFQRVRIFLERGMLILVRIGGAIVKRRVTL